MAEPPNEGQGQSQPIHNYIQARSVVITAHDVRKFNVKDSSIHHLGAIQGDLLHRDSDFQISTAQLQNHTPTDAPAGPGWVKLSENMFMNNTQPLKKGFKVYKGKQHCAGEWRNVAVKLIPYDENNLKEVKFHLKLEDHPNIIRMFDANVIRQGLIPYIYIVMEVCPQTLKDFVEGEKFDFEQRFSFAKQIVTGIAFIHSKQIVHRDIKLENILLSPSKGFIRVADFGLSKELNEGQSGGPVSSPGLGSDGFRAPEMHDKNPTASFRSDSFALGVVLTMLFSDGQHPFGQDPHRWRTNIIDKKGRDLSCIRHFTEPYAHKRNELIDLIRSCLKSNPADRPTSEKLLQHAFFSSDADRSWRRARRKGLVTRVARCLRSLFIDDSDHLRDLQLEAASSRTPKMFAQKNRKRFKASSSLKAQATDMESPTSGHLDRPKDVDIIMESEIGFRRNDSSSPELQQTRRHIDYCAGKDIGFSDYNSPPWKAERRAHPMTGRVDRLVDQEDELMYLESSSRSQIWQRHHDIACFYEDTSSSEYDKYQEQSFKGKEEKRHVSKIASRIKEFFGGRDRSRSSKGRTSRQFEEMLSLFKNQSDSSELRQLEIDTPVLHEALRSSMYSEAMCEHLIDWIQSSDLRKLLRKSLDILDDLVIEDMELEFRFDQGEMRRDFMEELCLELRGWLNSKILLEITIKFEMRKSYDDLCRGFIEHLRREHTSGPSSSR